MFLSNVSTFDISKRKFQPYPLQIMLISLTLYQISVLAGCVAAAHTNDKRSSRAALFRDREFYDTENDGARTKAAAEAMLLAEHDLELDNSLADPFSNKCKAYRTMLPRM